MVNVEKHKRLKAKFGMLPIENKELMHKLNASIIYETNESPQTIVDTLDNLNDEMNNHYNSLASSNVGSVLKVGTCQRILEVYEHVFVIKNTIQYNYHMLKIDGECIKLILRKCDRILNEFKNIQALQNNNIDNKTYGGFYSVVANENIDNVDDYPLENFESIVRLEEPIFIGDDSSNY